MHFQRPSTSSIRLYLTHSLLEEWSIAKQSEWYEQPTGWNRSGERGQIGLLRWIDRKSNLEKGRKKNFYFFLLLFTSHTDSFTTNWLRTTHHLLNEEGNKLLNSAVNCGEFNRISFNKRLSPAINNQSLQTVRQTRHLNAADKNFFLQLEKGSD